MRLLLLCLLPTLAILPLISIAGLPAKDPYAPPLLSDNFELHLEYYPIKRATLIRLLGLFESPPSLTANTKGPIDPFAADPPQNGYPTASPKPLEKHLTKLGFHSNEENGSSFAFDGEQLIVRASSEDHQKLAHLIRQAQEPTQVRISYWLEHEQSDTKQKPAVKKYPAASLQTNNGQRSVLLSESQGFSIATTPNIENHGGTTLICEIAFRTEDGAKLTLSTECFLPNSTDIQLAALTFESDSGTPPHNRETYRLMGKAELIGSEGTVRPPNDSLILRLGREDTFKHEMATFPMSQQIGLKIGNIDFLTNPNKAFSNYLRQNLNIKFNAADGTALDYSSHNNLLTVRHTPETLHRIRTLINSHAPDLTTENTWSISHTLEAPNRRSSEIIRISTRSISGKRIKFRYAKTEGEQIGEILLDHTTNIGNRGKLDTITNLSVSGINSVPKLKINDQSISQHGQENENLSMTRKVGESTLQESIVATSTAHAPRFALPTGDWMTESYPVHAGSAIRLTGYPTSRPRDPFSSKNSTSQSSIDVEHSALIRFFEYKGIPFTTTPGAQLTFDGERLIITQTKEAHQRIRNIFDSFSRPPHNNQVEVNFVAPDEATSGNLSIQPRSGKQAHYRVEWESEESTYFDLKLITNDADNNTTDARIEIDASASVFSGIPQLKLSSQFAAPERTPTRFASIPTSNDASAELIATIEPSNSHSKEP